MSAATNEVVLERRTSLEGMFDVDTRSDEEYANCVMRRSRRSGLPRQEWADPVGDTSLRSVAVRRRVRSA
jgi:hypothetical protein